METYVFVEHSPSCPNKANRFWRKCNCPKWIYIARERRRFSAKTRTWATAETLARKIEGGDTSAANLSGERVEAAVKLFLEDKKQQHIVPEYYNKLDYLLRKQLVPFCQSKPIVYLREITLGILEEFRKTWTGAAITKRKKQERLRSFFHYCVRHGWITTNPAVNLSRIRVEQKPTDYFTDAEFEKLIDSIPLFGLDSRNPNSQKWRDKILALILLMRWGGLRIGDAVGLLREKLVNNNLMLYTQKTGVPVYVPLPPETAKRLRDLANSNPDYFFWSGQGLLKSCVADYQRSFYRLCEHAKLGKRAHPHMLRDTFAIGLLLKGVPMDQVSILLGHRSIRITEKHYAPFCKARQEQLEASVRKSW